MKKNSNWRLVFVGRTKRTRRIIRTTALGIFALAGAAQAQSVIVPSSPSVPAVPPAIEALGPGEMQVFPTGSTAANVLDELNPLKWGPVTLRPHANYSFTYGTGIQSSPGQQQDSIIQTFSPGVLFVYDPHWTLDYTPSFTFYSDPSLKDNVAHSVALSGGTVYEDWVLGLSQAFSYTSASQVETGTQTDETSYSTSLSASHALNGKVSVDLGISQNFNFPSDFQSTKSWSTMDWLNYQYWPRLQVGVGAGGGYTIATPNSLNESVQGRINWRATDKLSIGVNGGPQFMQFTDGGAAPLINPTFGGSIQYLPFEHTQLSFGGSESTASSYYDNQVTTTTSLNAGLSQRLLKHYTLSVGGGYSWANNTAVGGNASANAASEYYSVNASLGTTIFKRCSVSVFYSYSDNVTSQSGLAYSSSQMGFNLGYAF